MNNKEEETRNKNIYAINSMEEAKIFDELLREYSNKISGIEHPPFLSLPNCWKRLQDVKEPNRIFTAVFDLKLALVLLNYDIAEIETANHKIVTDADEKLPIVGQPLDKFLARVDLHRSANGYILRYRAIFDKLMGLMVLLHSPNDYNGFLKAKSRRKSFRDIARKHPEIFPDDSVDNLIKSITMFDEGYRTSEVHNSGTLRKYSFSFDPKGAEYFGKLRIDSWNYLMAVLREIDKNIG